MPRRADDTIKNNISIYLVKQDLQNFEDILDDDTQEMQEYDENAIAYCERSRVHAPDWLVKFFKENENTINYIKQASSKVVLLKKLNITETETRIFAITFGRGKALLKDDVLEEQFGLKVVLNSIEANKIRRISKINIGKDFKASQEQMPKETNIYDFEFDINRDLVRYVTGKSDDELFGKNNITGGDIFNIKIDRDIDNINEFLIACYQRYCLTNYRTHFEWIDNIKEVRTKELIDNLNNQLVDEINNNADTVFMAVPDVVTWEDINHFRYSGDTSEYDDIDIHDFKSTFENETISSFDQIKNKRIRAMSGERSAKYEWYANKCLYANIDHEQKSYVFNGGKWYLIDNDFVRSINTSYNEIEISNIEFINYNHENENAYNTALTQSIANSIELHGINVQYGDSRSTIEPCDVFVDRNFIHIKRNGGSSYLSHLFNQATVSSEAFKDTIFRNRVNGKLRERNMQGITDENFVAQAYTVTLGIITKSQTERPRIPFFSKVAIRYAKRNIVNYGYSFNIKNIVIGRNE